MQYKKMNGSSSAHASSVRSTHPLRSFNFHRGDKVDLVYMDHPSSELKEFKNATFIKCYVKNDIDVAVLIHEGVTHVLPLSRVGMLGVSIDKIKQY